MCYEYEREYMIRRAEEARTAMQKAEEQLKKPKRAAPATPALEPGIKEREPVPA